MDILENVAAFDKHIHPKPVLAVGNFDGVHRGHQAILREVIGRAGEIGGTSMVLTFKPHPLQMLAPEHAPPLLTTHAQKMRLIAALGITVGVCVPFTEQFARQEPMVFVRDMLCHRLGVHDLVVGHDFRFGHRRMGTVAFLQEQAALFGYRVTVMPAIMQDAMVVSSSTIRRLLQDGHVEQAARLLGRSYTIEGPVVVECHLAKPGLPIAAIRPINALIPRTGVYAVRVAWDNRRYPGVAHVDYHLAFGSEAPRVQIHLFDVVLQRDFVTSHPAAPGCAYDGTDRRHGSAAVYTGHAPRPREA